MQLWRGRSHLAHASCGTLTILLPRRHLIRVVAATMMMHDPTEDLHAQLPKTPRNLTTRQSQQAQAKLASFQKETPRKVYARSKRSLKLTTDKIARELHKSPSLSLNPRARLT
mgnify:CR=1 FL=1